MSLVPFDILNQDIKTEDGTKIGWSESGWELLKKMVMLYDDIELYPLDFKRLEVYDEDFLKIVRDK